MAELNETPSASRTRIGVFGRRNAGKSTLVNALARQPVSIVSDVPGTTTDPVSKAMEIAPLGPCVLTDTAGLDDEGDLGAQRVAKTRAELEKTDIAIWVHAPEDDSADFAEFSLLCAARSLPLLEYRRSESADSLLNRLAALHLAEAPRPVIADLVAAGDCVILVCPQDGSAPKGRLILPQQQVIRELLDAHAAAFVCQPAEYAALLARLGRPQLVVTDSQVFAEVAAATPDDVKLTSFSILFARAKGDLDAFLEGVAALKKLKDGDRVLIAEGCTHHRQCGDIGTVKLPQAIMKLTGVQLDFAWCSGNGFPEDISRYALVIHCGGCMLTRRMMLSRIARCRASGVPIANYGLVFAACKGLPLASLKF